ncbi:hypothetical protein ACIG5E_33740 [Kitasatospora sp. NPDC053057]|uniref:hypothetical protein n=1 Tax=Kitasatospora sp. NPDC053057 TaxID=3364062 RepID=UPI0037C79266
MPSDTANPATVMIAAESIDLTPTEPRQDADAAVRTARSARDEEDLVLLLTALGLPSGEDELARLAPNPPPRPTPPAVPTRPTEAPPCPTPSPPSRPTRGMSWRTWTR